MIQAIPRGKGGGPPGRKGRSPRHVPRVAAILAGLSLAFAAQQVGAAEREDFMIDTTADLADLCGADPAEENFVAAVHMCQGYLLGVHHFHAAMTAAVEEGLYCFERASPRPTRDQVMADFAGWVDRHPEVAQTEALEGVLTWAAEIYPCQGAAQMGGMDQ